MYCMKCSHHVARCTCPDIAERLSGLGQAGTHTAVKWCTKCDNHYARCKCAVPEFVLRRESEDRPLPVTPRN